MGLFHLSTEVIEPTGVGNDAEFQFSEELIEDGDSTGKRKFAQNS
jgi:hypothetical protein